MATTEEELIRRIRSIFPQPSVGLGVGDDAAIHLNGGVTVVTSDMLIEDVDFTMTIPLLFVARKAVAANLSDLAAMGASPRALVLGLAFPPTQTEVAEKFLEAFADAASTARVDVIGGDLSRSEKWMISVTALGDLTAETDALLRSGASPGERIFVSRPIGASAAGLKLLGKGWSILEDGTVHPPPEARKHGFAQREFASSVIRFHVAPEAESQLGVLLSREKLATACIDLSDGLSSDLSRLCEASGIGATIDWEKVPIFPDLHRTGFTLGIDSEKAALHGGEEYALLFTSTLRESELSTRLGRPVYAIGRTTDESGMKLVRDGAEIDLLPAGFDHFTVVS